MTRISRLKEYSATKGPKGEASSQTNLDYWARRAEVNSDGDQHRASDGPMKLQKTGKSKRSEAGTSDRFSFRGGSTPELM